LEDNIKVECKETYVLHSWVTGDDDEPYDTSKETSYFGVSTESTMKALHLAYKSKILDIMNSTMWRI